MYVFGRQTRHCGIDKDESVTRTQVKLVNIGSINVPITFRLGGTGRDWEHQSQKKLLQNLVVPM